MAGFVYLEHENPEIPGGCQVPDSPDVIAMYEARGWVVRPTPVELDPDAPNTGALPSAVDPGPEQPEQPEQPADPGAAPAGDDPAAAAANTEQPATKPARNRTAAPADEQNGE